MSPSENVEQVELQVLAEIQAAKHRLQLATPEAKSDALRGLRDAVQEFSRIVLDGVVPATGERQAADTVAIPLGTTLREAVHLLMEATLQSVDGNVSAAARILQVNRATIWKRIKQHKPRSSHAA